MVNFERVGGKKEAAGAGAAGCGAHSSVRGYYLCASGQLDAFLSRPADGYGERSQFPTWPRQLGTSADRTFASPCCASLPSAHNCPSCHPIARTALATTPPRAAPEPEGDGGKKKKKDKDRVSGTSASHFIVDVLVNVALPPGSTAGAGGSSLPRGQPVKLLPPGDKSGTPMVVTFSLNQVGSGVQPEHPELHMAPCTTSRRLSNMTLIQLRATTAPFHGRSRRSLKRLQSWSRRPAAGARPVWRSATLRNTQTLVTSRLTSLLPTSPSRRPLPLPCVRWTG